MHRIKKYKKLSGMQQLSQRPTSSYKLLRLLITWKQKKKVEHGVACSTFHSLLLCRLREFPFPKHPKEFTFNIEVVKKLNFENETVEDKQPPPFLLGN